MSNYTAASAENEPDLFDLAATLAGCAPVDLLKVRRDPAGLVVILATGQKYIFHLGSIAPTIETAIRAQLANVLGLDLPPIVGAKQDSSASPLLI